ncbi:putative deoxyribodipyrimidine photo-lyase [Medicago truncatula]|uniref:Cryptochrome 2B apoprotein n=1 Tax=Medicago truncatula TaxID=3880 RepID=G7I4R1_MEDTR|nr:cryptochrome-1 [Medicago truncatula]AES60287.1 cryptochrome 2B apoprotein [Medicago truncatula]RHN78601.1 putative deoxyribodipyrimidine photo-lyase [Medicago truncatula]
MNRTIVWFRRDLRIEDNPALAAAARDGSVFPVFICCPKEEGQFYPGRVSRWWLKQSLYHLDQSLKSLGAGLVMIKTDSTLKALLECVNAVQAKKVVFNHLYDPVSLVRDHNIKEKLVELGISVQSYNGDLLHEPWDIYDESGHAFTTFDPFWSRCLQMQMKTYSTIPPCQLIPAQGKVEKHSIEQLGLEDELETSSNALLSRAWSPGWSKSDKALTEFVENHLIHYSKNRLNLGVDSTSLLSPYIHFGELSVRKVFQLVRTKQILWKNEGNIVGEESATFFLRAIGFREYSRYLCFSFPFTVERPLLGNLKFFPWNTDPSKFKAWRLGRTGYPLVDAGMRELWATGWIHNKMRVIVSSFAVKMLLIPWKWGMKYFWDTLLDADLESDILGWQYISGSLPDGHELERLDDPEIQGTKYDPEGEYIRQWLPELARIPTEWIHHPWNAPLTVLKASGIELGQNYPKPIIEIDLAREQLTQAIFKMWEDEAASKASTSENKHEVVDDSENLSIPKVFLKDKAPRGATSSSNDQKVPILQNPKIDDPPNRKKQKCMDKEDREQDSLSNLSKRTDTGVSCVDQEVCSTAESSSKRQSSSTCSFYVP